MPELDGPAAGAALLAAVGAGLAIVTSMLVSEARADLRPVGLSRPYAPAPEEGSVVLAERAAPHTGRYGLRTTP
ncbi:hypothetical protein GCM10010289_82960 [Streptomyces violascens]|nr:hypothetical protein GCM10010289_82960 [Streptomyces violascens]